MTNPRTLEFGDVCVDVDRMVVQRGGARVVSSPRCSISVDHRDRLITKDELLDGVWRDTFVTPNASEGPTWARDGSRVLLMRGPLGPDETLGLRPGTTGVVCNQINHGSE